MSSFSYRPLVIIVLIISLSSIIAIILYFFTKDVPEEESVEPVVPAIISPQTTFSTEPSVNDALAALFSLQVTEQKVKLDKNTLASLWFKKTFNDGKNDYHTIFIKNQIAETNTHEIYGGHADAPTISAVVYKKEHNHWLLVSKQKNIGVFGSWGDTPKIEQVKLFPLSIGNMALLVNISYSGQGYTNSGKTIFSYYENRWSQLGYLQTNGNNSGACDDESEEIDDLIQACWHFEGSISLVKNHDDLDYPDIMVNRVGTMNGKKGKVTPVKNSLYTFNGEEYLEVIPETD